MDNMPISRVQIAATFVFLIALGTTLVLLSLVFLAIATNTMSGEVGGGKFYLLFIQNDDAFGFIKGLAAILSLGATTVAAPKSNNTVYYLTIFSAFISVFFTNHRLVSAIY